ncbi:MAG: hypothetical protein JWP25_6192 [Bradyrhizobium sp.]|nr:hypothetical protein [Bradyrhizobium sp.]MEA2869265.1 hypothetical protein [Bradyrhizobium sp.]
MHVATDDVAAAVVVVVAVIVGIVSIVIGSKAKSYSSQKLFNHRSRVCQCSPSSLPSKTYAVRERHDFEPALVAIWRRPEDAVGVRNG